MKKPEYMWSQAETHKTRSTLVMNTFVDSPNYTQLFKRCDEKVGLHSFFDFFQVWHSSQAYWEPVLFLNYSKINSVFFLSKFFVSVFYRLTLPNETY